MKLFKKNTFNSIFFWNKKNTKPEPFVRIVDELIKRIPDVRKIIKEEQRKERYENRDVAQSDGQIIGRMYDFYNAFANNEHHFGDIAIDNFDDGNAPANPMSGDVAGMLPPPPKIEIEKLKPADVVDKLETVPERNLTTQNLDDMILLFKDKSSMLRQRYAKNEVDGFVKRLQNRKHYEEHRDFYKLFPNTTDEKIKALTDKYDLVMKEIELFIPTLPKEAIEVMKEYNLHTKKFTDETLVYYVIAEKKDFKNKYDKLDPILLVQSPFGFFWQILGAWDKEMLLLSEL